MSSETLESGREFINKNIVHIAMGICGLIVFIIFVWICTKMTLKERNCSTLHELYKLPPPGFSDYIIEPGVNDCYTLRDFYIKTAYNCCATGSYRNDFVGLCALKDCIRQGARCLDFEIYSLHDKPVVAVSAIDNYHVKGSYNSLDFADVLSTINSHAFGGKSVCPNPNDPLILYLRIMSNNRKIYDTMAKNLYNTLEHRLLGKEYSYEYNGKNLGTVKMTDLMKKVIIIVDKTNSLVESTPLDEYVNAATRGAFMRVLRYNEVVHPPSPDELVEFNKKNMTLCLPNLGITPRNPSSSLSMASGCQLTAMAFQNFDSSLEVYMNYFDSRGTAFVLKPKILRYIPAYETKPPPQDPAVSYETRHVSIPYQKPLKI